MDSLDCIDKMVGVAGFEPATTCSQSKCATRLRYTPLCTIAYYKSNIASCNSSEYVVERLELQALFLEFFDYLDHFENLGVLHWDGNVLAQRIPDVLVEIVFVPAAGGG